MTLYVNNNVYFITKTLKKYINVLLFAMYYVGSLM